VGRRARTRAHRAGAASDSPRPGAGSAHCLASARARARARRGKLNRRFRGGRPLRKHYVLRPPRASPRSQQGPAAWRTPQVAQGPGPATALGLQRAGGPPSLDFREGRNRKARTRKPLSPRDLRSETSSLSDSGLRAGMADGEHGARFDVDGRDPPTVRCCVKTCPPGVSLGGQIAEVSGRPGRVSGPKGRTSRWGSGFPGTRPGKTCRGLGGPCGRASASGRLGLRDYDRGTPAAALILSSASRFPRAIARAGSSAGLVSPRANPFSRFDLESRPLAGLDLLFVPGLDDLGVPRPPVSPSPGPVSGPRDLAENTGRLCALRSAIAQRGSQSAGGFQFPAPRSARPSSFPGLRRDGTPQRQRDQGGASSTGGTWLRLGDGLQVVSETTRAVSGGRLSRSGETRATRDSGRRETISGHGARGPLRRPRRRPDGAGRVPGSLRSASPPSRLRRPCGRTLFDRALGLVLRWAFFRKTRATSLCADRRASRSSRLRCFLRPVVPQTRKTLARKPSKLFVQRRADAQARCRGLSDGMAPSADRISRTRSSSSDRVGSPLGLRRRGLSAQCGRVSSTQGRRAGKRRRPPGGERESIS
jgi:hypothetical protein